MKYRKLKKKYRDFLKKGSLLALAGLVYMSSLSMHTAQAEDDETESEVIVEVKDNAEPTEEPVDQAPVEDILEPAEEYTGTDVFNDAEETAEDEVQQPEEKEEVIEELQAETGEPEEVPEETTVENTAEPEETAETASEATPAAEAEETTVEEPAETEQPEEPEVQMIHEDVYFTDDSTDLTVNVKAAWNAFPEGTVMIVTPVEDEALEAVRDTAGETLDEGKVIRHVEAVDISFYYPSYDENDPEQNKIEPEAPIQVTLASKDIKESKTNDDVNAAVVHIDSEGQGEVIDQLDEEVLEEAPAEDEIVFESDAFSVYAVVYTVDFTYEDYTFSIEGESSILLSDLFARLQINTAVSEVLSVTFTNEELIRIEKEGEDWRLTSLAPFSTEEKLTVTTAEKQIEITVTDEMRSSDFDGANFKVESVSRGAVTTTYCSTFGEAIDKANENTNNNAAYGVTITFLSDEYTLTPGDCKILVSTNGALRHPVVFDGVDNKVLKADSSVTAAWISTKVTGNNGTVTFKNIVFDGSGCSSSAPLLNNVSTYAAPVTFMNCSILRGDMKGVLVEVGDNPVAFENCTIDGQGKKVTKSLIHTGKGNLTLTNTTVTGHTATGAGICAVDARESANIFVTGSTSIYGNKDSVGEANLSVIGNSKLKFGSDFSGKIGITTPNCTNGKQFANAVSGTKTWTNIHCDIDPELTAKQNNSTNVIWNGPAAPASFTVPSGTARNNQYDPNYGQAGTGKETESVTVKVPLTKVLQSNQDTEKTSKAVQEEVFRFELACSPADGVQISPKAVYELSAADIFANGTSSGNLTTLTLKDGQSPWTLTFSKKGTYTVTVSEKADANSGVSRDNSTTTLTYHVVEEEGSLRLAEAYKEAGTEETAGTYGTNLSPIPVERLFRVSTTKERSTTITADPNDKQKLLLEIGADTGGAITPEFTFDFSRSFKITGQLRVPDSDGVGFAFHGNPNKTAYRLACNNGLDNLEFNQFSAPTNDKLARGYTPEDTEITRGFMVNLMTRDLNQTWGIFAYGITGNHRIPYKTSVGLNGQGYWPFDSAYEDAHGYKNARENHWSDFTIEFVCQNPDTGAGTLKFDLFGQHFEFNDFVASGILGPDVWQNAYFSLGGSVQAGTCSLQLLSEEYTESIGDAVTTSFWADRNGDNVFETQVNTTNSPALPGETILVRHVMTREDSTSGLFYEKALIRQLVDATSNTKLTGRDEHSYPEGNPAGSITCGDGNYNSDSPEDSLEVAVFPNNTKTVFEYKITAPDANDHYVTEQAVFGQEPFKTVYTKSYGFRTQKELKWETPTFTNTAEISSVTYNPNGGTFADNTTANKVLQYLKGTTCTVISPAPTKEGYVFQGWKKDDTTTYNPADTFTVTGDVTLTAQWEKAYKLTVNVSFADSTDDAAYTDGLKSVTYKIDNQKELVVSLSGKQGSAYLEVAAGEHTVQQVSYVTADDQTVAAVDGEFPMYNLSVNPASQAVTITDAGVSITYINSRKFPIVTYDANGGTGTLTTPAGINANKQAIPNFHSAVTLSDGTGFSRNQYVLKSWNTKADGTGTKYELGAALPTCPFTEDITLYAQWEKTTPAPTGIHFPMLPYVLMFAGGMALVMLLGMRHRRRWS